jgi:hypothetical protein
MILEIISNVVFLVLSSKPIRALTGLSPTVTRKEKGALTEETRSYPPGDARTLYQLAGFGLTGDAD